MIARSGRKAGYLAVLVTVVGMLVPGVSSAATPAITGLNVFGNRVPGTAGAADPVTGSATLYASSLPYGAGTDPGNAYVTGKVENFTLSGSGELQVLVTITFSDGADSRTRTVEARRFQDAGFPSPEGDQGYFKAELNVTDLGVHKVTNPTGTATERGITDLSVTISAQNLAVAETATLPNASKPAPIILQKYAGTANDTYQPRVSRNITYPPANWCHLSSNGGVRFGSGGSYLESDAITGSDTRGSCGNIGMSGVGHAPAVAWIPCAVAPDSVPGVYGPGDGFPPQNGRQNVCPKTQRDSTPKGNVLVSGGFMDNDTSINFGVASEIASVEVQMTQGANVVRSYSSDVPNSGLNLIRTGFNAAFNVTIWIDDFKPNYRTGDPYVVKVIAKDAWGNTRTVQSGNITIYPW